MKTVADPRPTRNPRKIIFGTPMNSYRGLNDIRNAKKNSEKFINQYRPKNNPISLTKGILVISIPELNLDLNVN